LQRFYQVSRRTIVTARYSTHNFRLIFGLTVLLLLWIGLQAAYSHTLHDGSIYHPEVRVDRCHLDIEHTEIEPCCQSNACHRSTPVKRDLDSPGYHTQQSASHLLIHESQTQTPQLKAGSPLKQTYAVPHRFLSQIRPPESPLRSLSELKTVILLH
jgi:hypothetical protein